MRLQVYSIRSPNRRHPPLQQHERRWKWSDDDSKRIQKIIQKCSHKLDLLHGFDAWSLSSSLQKWRLRRLDSSSCLASHNCFMLQSPEWRKGEQNQCWFAWNDSQNWDNFCCSFHHWKYFLGRLVQATRWSCLLHFAGNYSSESWGDRCNKG